MVNSDLFAEPTPKLPIPVLGPPTLLKTVETSGCSIYSFQFFLKPNCFVEWKYFYQILIQTEFPLVACCNEFFTNNSLLHHYCCSNKKKNTNPVNMSL
jgi:hypothetical protein